MMNSPDGTTFITGHLAQSCNSVPGAPASVATAAEAKAYRRNCKLDNNIAVHIRIGNIENIIGRPDSEALYLCHPLALEFNNRYFQYPLSQPRRFISG